MKNPTCLICVLFLIKQFLNSFIKDKKKLFYLILISLGNISAFAQLAVPFTPRLDGGSIKVRGDVVLIGNSIIAGEGATYALPYSGTDNNNGTRGIYINVESGGDPSIFSSSSANLNIDNTCKEILYAGLYWSSVYPLEVANNSGKPFEGTPRLEDWNQIKFRLPTGGFIDLEADNNADPAGEEDDIIFDGFEYNGPGVENSFKDSPIICYKNVTNLLRGLGEADGKYTVANLRATRGSRNGGCSAGWTLVVIYESPLLSSKQISLFDGYAGIGGSTVLEIPVSGFQTLPDPLPVRANIGVAALEGDFGIKRDSYEFKANSNPNFTTLSDAINKGNNFFNSTITSNGVHVLNRNPASTNTLGLDINTIDLPNPSNSVLPNDETAGDLRLTTNGDGYGVFLTHFSVEIIAPEIQLTKVVEDPMGNDISNALVELGDELNYIIGFQNTGNDDAVGLTIRDVLPDNVVFNYPDDLSLLPAGVTVQSFDPDEREIIFEVDDSAVEQDDPLGEIRFKVRVVTACSLLNNACSNIISNQAFSTYRGALDPSFIKSDDPSFSSNTGCLLTPAATNFLAHLDCTFEEEVLLCGDSTTLTSGDGYDSYSWSRNPSGIPVIGTTQTITITETGTYYVENTAVAPCQSTSQVFEVITFGQGVPNPVIPFADEVATCPNDGKLLPNIFICGGNGPRLIETGITDTTSIIWEKLDEESCVEVSNINCANESDTCTWNQVQTGADFLADTAGQYRLTLNYDGGCFNRFYFNVYTNLLVPTVNSRDIFCTNPGEITVNGIPSGYEYSIDGVNYQTSNVFPINTADIYTVYIKIEDLDPNPCIFTVPGVQVRQTDFTVSRNIMQPFCNGDLGSVNIAANDVRPQYYFDISQGGTSVNSIGPITPNQHTFSNLNPGIYTINVSTDDGCMFSDDIEIIEPGLLEATSALTEPFTSCFHEIVDEDGDIILVNPGEITIYPTGGTAPYFYFINGDTNFSTEATLIVTAPGNYDIRIVDNNNCETNTSITVEEIAPPEFVVNKTDILCSGGNNGEININVTNTNNNILRYSIDNGANYFTSPNFTGLSVADYEVIVEYTATGSTISCASDPETVSIIELEAVDATVELSTDYSCLANGVITVSNVTGGSSPYEYSIDGVNFQSGLTFPGLTNGSYTITVTDSNDCTFIANPIVINPLNPPTDLDFSNTALSCPLNTSNVTLTATGGDGVLEYQIIAPSGEATAYQPSNEFLNLDPGTYTFQVNDANGCTYSESYTIDPLPAISVVGQTINDITCFGASDGAVRFTVSETTNFVYTINGGASISGTFPINETNLSVGTYTIVITDLDTNCTATTSATVSGPITALSVTTTVSPLSCSSNGSVVINTVGGTGGYSYELTLPDASTLPSQNTNTFSNLTQVGTYSISVTDNNNCVVTDTFSISLPGSPTGNIDASSNYCIDGTNGATLVVNALGGVSPYQYSINSEPFDTNNTFSNLIAGTYTITIRDALGCDVTLPSEVIANQLSVAATLDKELDCTISPDALITGTITGGYAPYTYAISVNGAAYTTIGTTGTPFTNEPDTAGTYQFQITDNEGCTAESAIVTVNAITNPTSTVTAVNPNCNGETSGSVQIIPSGGVGPYTYSFNGSAFTTTSLYTGLSAGPYTYEVRDSKSCPVTGSGTLTAPVILDASATVIPFSCSATNTVQSATVTISTPTGGTSPYTYSFNGSSFSSISSITINDTGVDQTITWEVRDGQNCTIGGSEVISTLNSPTDLDFSATTVSCLVTTSDVTLTPTNGVGSLTYIITAPAAAISNTTGVSTGIFTGLTPDTYIFRVTDANGCFYEESYTVTPVTPIAVTGLLISDVSCNGGNDGAVTFNISGFGNTYSYAINGGTAITGQTVMTIPLTGLSNGNQIIVVTDEVTGCTATETINVSQPTNPLSFTTTTTNVFCTNDESQITVTASNGTPSYTYAAVLTTTGPPALGDYNSNNAVTVDTNGAVDLIWDVYVRDTNGCIAMNTVTITADGLPTVSVPTLASNQCTATSGFTFDATGTGVAPLSYSINGGASYQTSPTFIVNTPGNYTVTIRDGNGCTATSSTSIEIFSGLSSGASLDKDLTCSVPMAASIGITTTGGNTPYTYEVTSDGGTTYTTIAGSPYTTGVSGTYRFRITDANGCEVLTNDVIVNPTIMVLATEVLAQPTCNGATDGSIAISATAGEAPFTYSIDGTNFVTSNTFGGLSSGSHTYFVRDSKNCEFTKSITLTEPALIDVTIQPTGIVCNLNTPGNFEATINSGGIAPFTYTLYDTSFNQLDTSGITAATTHMFPGLTFGEYYIIIVDASGCEYNSGIQRIETPPIISIGGVLDSNNCTTGVDFTVTATGGVADYVFSIFGQSGTESAPQSTNSYTYTGLLHNTTYFLQVRDSNNCISVLEVDTPIAPSTIEITGITSTNVTCNGDSNGTLNFTVQNYDPTVTDINYEILDALSLLPVAPAINGTLTGALGGPVSESITTLSAGNYVLQVREASGTLCPANYTFLITQPAQSVNANITANIPANCNVNSQVTISATGGSGPYTYEAGVTGFVQGSGDVPNSTNNVLILDDTIRTNWEILVIDVNDCSFRLPVTVGRIPNPTINPVAQQCYSGTPLNITLSGTVSTGTPTYSIGGAFQTDPNFVISTPGTYTLTIRDGNGCIATTTYEVEPQLLLDAELTQDLLCDTDASITLTASGGTGTYTTYEVSSDGGANYTATSSGGVTHVTNVAGTYQFKVTDTQTCEAEYASIVVTPVTMPTLTFIQANITCNGDDNGSIVVTASNGIAPYQYSIDNGANYQASNTFTGLIPSTLAVTPYNIVVRDSKNCVSAATLVTITEPTIVTGMANLTQSLSCGIANSLQSAIVTITGDGGTIPYTYSFDGGANYTSSNTFTTNIATTVNAFVRDANGCISSVITQVIPPLDPPTDLDFMAAAITCTNLTTDVTLNTTNGVGILTYEILSPVSATGNTTGLASGIFTGLTPDTYLFEVTDANGCTYEEAYTIDSFTNITVSGLLNNNVTCNGLSNGAVTFTVSNFATTYSYTINGSIPITGQTATTIPLTGLSNGNQVIVVTDEATNCTATTTVTVIQPQDLVLSPDTNINANCNFGSQVSVTSVGGTLPHRYAFVQDGVIPVALDYTTSNSRVLDPTVNTVWDVYVQDANGCVDDIEINIDTTALPTVTLPLLASNQCNLTGDPYTFTISSSTGLAPLEYSIGNGFQASDTFTVSSAGTYSVTVRDANGCTAVSPTSITIYEPLGITPMINALPSCIVDDGEITLNTIGGSSNYTYEITAGPLLQAAQPSNMFSGLPSGNYTIRVTDAITLCTRDVSVDLSIATPVTFTTIPTNVSCNGGSDGTITVNLPATNDNPIYTYEITAPIVRAAQTSNIFEDLPANTYTIRVNSGRGCFLIDTETIAEPVLLSTSGLASAYSCNASNVINTSTLDISQVGGTAPYKYSIDGVNYFDSNSFEIIDNGVTQIIDVFVQDNNNCIASNVVTIEPLEVITATFITEATPIDCNETGSISITVTGGSGNFTYQMLPSGVAQASNIFNITEPGDYYFQVNDVTTGCYVATTVFTVTPFDNGNVELIATSPVTCFGDSAGTLEINITDYIGAYTYQIFDSFGAPVNGLISANTSTNPEIVTGITGGSYNVVITETDSPFCNLTSNFATVLSPPIALSLDASETSNVTCNDGLGTITAIAFGGWGTHEYELTGTATVAYSSNGTFTNLSMGSYTVNVRDAGGCIVSENLTLMMPMPITATVTASTTLLSCFGDTDAEINVSAVNGGENANYTYTLNMLSPTVSSSGPQTQPVFTGLGAGTYSVVINDGLNCEFISTNVIIGEPTEVEANLIKATSQSCNAQSTLTLSASGGTGVYEYSATEDFASVIGSFVNSVTFPVPNGTYSYYVRDAIGCSSTVSNEITDEPLEILEVNLRSTSVIINCAGDDNGSIEARASGGIGGSYIYTLQDEFGNAISPVTEISPGVFIDLPEGDYLVQVEGGDCLEVSEAISIRNSGPLLIVNFNEIDVTCNGENDGILEIDTIGGTGEIKYAISPRLDQFFDIGDIEDLSPGNYDVIVQDEAGCFALYNFDITEPLPIGFNYVINSEAPCDGDTTAEFTVQVFGGEPPYSVSLDDVNYIALTPSVSGTYEYTFTNLEGGEKMVYVLDNANCGGDSPFSVPLLEPVVLEPLANIDYDCINDSLTNTNTVTNIVTVTVDSSITDTSGLEYALDGGAFSTGTGVFTNLSVGPHSIEVRHPNGCVQVTDDNIPFIIETFQPLALELTEGEEINTILAEAMGGAEPYEYRFNGQTFSADENTFLYFESGDYTITVIDANGCEVSATRFFEFIDVCIPNYFTPNGDGNLDEWEPGCTIQYKNLTFDIFDRYGRKIATLNLGESWDGKYGSKELPSGDYWYIVKTNEPQYDREFVGHFTLYR